MANRPARHGSSEALRLGLLMVAVSVMAAASTDAKVRRPPPCPGGVFWVEGEPLVASGLAAPDAVAVESGAVSLLSGCGPTTAKLKGTRRGTKLKAKWQGCLGVEGWVKLKARIDSSCTGMRGKLRARGLRRSFAAHTHVAACGDGRLDSAERCDDGGMASCDGCAADCSRQDAVCGDGIVECGEACDGEGTCAGGESCENCRCAAALTCAEASACGAREYCSAARDCLCIRSAEGPILCGHIPPRCDVQLCQTSADCAHLGEGYFCDTPNSGCCSDPPQEIPRCIAPCERPPCPPERVCGTNCCPVGSGCAGDACCPLDRICGTTCCPAGERCEDGACAPLGACPDDPVTEDSITAARAALEGGATEAALSPGGCTLYRRTLDGDQVTSERLIVAGRTASETTHAAAGSTMHEDRNLDGMFDWEATLTRGTDPAPEISVAIRELDLETGEELSREERTVHGDTVHVVVVQGGTVVNQFDTPVEQRAGRASAAAAAPDTCDQAHDKRSRDDLARCLGRTPKCLEKHGRGDVARKITKVGAKVSFRCADLGDALAQTNAREAAFGAKPVITINPGRMDGASEDIRTATICHELMHHSSLGLHDLGLDGVRRKGEIDPVIACEQLCGYAMPLAPATKCQCATCLGTVVCDPRCKGYRECDPDMGAMCPCTERHIWYPTYTICKEECPSGLKCFGYSDCINFNRGCD